MKYLRFIFLLLMTAIAFPVFAQDSSAFTWNVQSKKTGDTRYRLSFSSAIKNNWSLFTPGQDLGGVTSVEIIFADSSIKAEAIRETSSTKEIVSSVFDNKKFHVFEKDAALEATIHLSGKIPAQLLGIMHYYYAKGDEFYNGSFSFTVTLEGGTASVARIHINSFDLKHPVNNCGDEGTEGKGLWSIFLLGIAGGLIALLTPCVFPLIPLTVSFFTKRSGKSGVGHGILYGFFIFLIYILLSVPFHLLDHINPEILNNISTNIWLNIAFFVIFVVFAISFFGFFEITLPGAVANSVDSKAGLGSIAGIFFMALTLAIVSFSCTGPILGTLLAGALSNNGGAIQLSFGMAGFGFGLAFPFALFAMFPGWLHSLPKSGGWLTSVKVVLGFLELAMAIKFLSQADLVEQWGIIKREIFIGFWVLSGILIVLYLFGKIRFPHDSPVKKFSKTRIAFIIAFSAFTLYLVPGLFNIPAANLPLISGFPPPLCYSVYQNPVNCEKGIEPLRDYETAIALGKKLHKPVLIDFTGWACVNCRRMEENVWTDPQVNQLMKNDFIVVSLYVDERKILPASEQQTFLTKDKSEKRIITVGDKWATFQSENFNDVSQPRYAIINGDEKILTKTKGYTPDAANYSAWLKCGIDAFKKVNNHD